MRVAKYIKNTQIKTKTIWDTISEQVEHGDHDKLIIVRGSVPITRRDGKSPCNLKSWWKLNFAKNKSILPEKKHFDGKTGIFTEKRKF